MIISCSFLLKTKLLNKVSAIFQTFYFSRCKKWNMLYNHQFTTSCLSNFSSVNAKKIANIILIVINELIQ